MRHVWKKDSCTTCELRRAKTEGGATKYTSKAGTVAWKAGPCQATAEAEEEPQEEPRERVMGARQRHIRVALQRVDRTDLMCVVCGRFRTEWSITHMLSDADVQVGVHQKCIDQLHQKRGA